MWKPSENVGRLSVGGGGGVKSFDRCLSQSVHKLNQPLPNFWHSYSLSFRVVLLRRHCYCWLCCCGAFDLYSPWKGGPIILAPRDFRERERAHLPPPLLLTPDFLTSWLLTYCPHPRASLLSLVTACRH